MKNINAAKKLLQLYKSITFWQIVKTYLKQVFKTGIYEFEGDVILNILTGFGTPGTCLLCKSAKELSSSYEPNQYCQHCVYVGQNGYAFDCTDDTYVAILDSNNARQLYKALQNRIKYLEIIIKKTVNEEIEYNS